MNVIIAVLEVLQLVIVGAFSVSFTASGVILLVAGGVLVTEPEHRDRAIFGLIMGAGLLLMGILLLLFGITRLA